VAALFALRVTAAFFLGAVIPVANLAIRASVPPERQGAAFGVAASVTSVAFGIGPLAGGFLASAYGFGAPFFAPGLLLLAASAAILVSAILAGSGPAASLRSVRRLFKIALSWIVSL
jgi:MFS family permease